MAELTPEERLQPSLLDRLVDDEPESTQESRDARVLTVEKLRASVLRDLEWLLNTTNLEACGEDLSATPHVQSSTVNFGTRGLAGSTYSNLEPRKIEQDLEEAIRRFEPRILPDTLRVKVHIEAKRLAHDAVTFEIEGVLWADPIEEQLFLKTKLDLDTGACTIESVR